MIHCLDLEYKIFNVHRTIVSESGNGSGQRGSVSILNFSPLNGSDCQSVSKSEIIHISVFNKISQQGCPQNIHQLLLLRSWRTKWSMSGYMNVELKYRLKTVRLQKICCKKKKKKTARKTKVISTKSVFIARQHPSNESPICGRRIQKSYIFLTTEDLTYIVSTWRKGGKKGRFWIFLHIYHSSRFFSPSGRAGCPGRVFLSTHSYRMWRTFEYYGTIRDDNVFQLHFKKGWTEL